MKPRFAIDDDLLRKQLDVIRAAAASWQAVVDGAPIAPEDLKSGEWRKNFVSEMRLIAGTAATLADVESNAG